MTEDAHGICGNRQNALQGGGLEVLSRAAEVIEGICCVVQQPEV
jgi:hypothetical protein